MELINTLESLRKMEKLTDEEFAKKLNVHRTTWIRVKTNKIGVSISFLRKVLTVYPKLKKEADYFLSESATNGSSNVTLTNGV